MIRFLKLFLLVNSLLFLANCSFSNPGNFFEDRVKELEKEILQKNSKLVFSRTKKFNEEISGTTVNKIEKSILISNWQQKNLTSSNVVPHLKYENKKQLIYKSKKIGKNKFDTSNSLFEPLILNDNVFLYDYTGNIYNFSIKDRQVIWKYNFYKKRYKNIPIIIKLKISKNYLIALDNLGFAYSLEIDSGKIKWAKNYGIPFKSNVKLDKENIFILNQDNKYFSIDERNGNQKLSLETFPSFLKSKHDTNVCLDTQNNNIYFITSNGELYSINYQRNSVNWFSTISIGTDRKRSELFYSSPIVCKNDTIFFSTSVATYAIDSRNSSIKWQLPFSTFLRPIVTDDFVFLASKNGFFLNINKKTGKVIWSKDIFKTSKKFKKNKIGDILSLILVSDQILATTSKGFFIFLDYRNGKIINYTRASRAGFFSSPVVVNQKIYILDKKMRVLIFN